MAGYSGTPLIQKLGIREGMPVLAVGAPPDYARLLGALPEGSRIVTSARGEIPFIHLFTRSAASLRTTLERYRKRLESGGVIWVSWPKRAAKIPTDVTEDVIREIALPLGLVDVKVCAVDETWSALKLVIRKSER